MFRVLLAIISVLLALIAMTPSSSSVAADMPPIVFVHGNGDTAALWHTTIWRFESNGYDPNRLMAVNIPAPMAPADDTKPEENRSTTADQAAALAGFVARTLIATGAEKVVLVGNSRGANTIRNYVRFGGGHAHVALVVLGGGVNHGVYAADRSPNSEFNGKSAFMNRLNAGSEVHAGIRFVTIRSDKLDKYAQPTGEFIGRPGQPTGVDYDAPALAGAQNIVLPGLDHREVAFHSRAFAILYEAVMGQPPDSTEIKPEAAPQLDGMVGGFANSRTLITSSWWQRKAIQPSTSIAHHFRARAATSISPCVRSRPPSRMRPPPSPSAGPGVTSAMGATSSPLPAPCPRASTPACRAPRPRPCGSRRPARRCRSS